jgi:hypothetical protein
MVIVLSVQALARLGETVRFARSCGDSDQGIQSGKFKEKQKIRLIEGGV